MTLEHPHPNLAGVGADGVTPRVDLLAWFSGGYTIDRWNLLHGPVRDDGRPSVVHTLLPEGLTQRQIRQRAAILHSNAGSSPSRWEQLRAFLLRATDTEPHLQLDGPWSAGGVDGQFAQFVPFDRRADCNYKANGWTHDGDYWGALSIETGDNGAGSLAVTPWTLPMFAALRGALVAFCVTYGIACTPTTAWDDSGIGYHSQFAEWSAYKGKTCPGAARIRQVPQLLSEVQGRLALYHEHAGSRCGA